MKSVDEIIAFIDGIQGCAENVSLEMPLEWGRSLRNEIHSLRQRLAEAEAKVPKWLPIETYVFEKNKPIWVGHAPSRTMILCFPEEKLERWQIMWNEKRFLNWTPTHWMPPHAPPEGDKAI